VLMPAKWISGSIDSPYHRDRRSTTSAVVDPPRGYYFGASQ
jgi:hypothetical protein